MSLPVRLLPEARTEYDEAADWYEQQRAGLGADLVARVREVFTRIAANPKLHAKVYKEVRKAVVAKFPYIVLYQEEPGEVLVVSVFHTARDPVNWQSRV
jgi:plasmid stabilization system protein ParE